jgi:hypothetical protein
MTRTLIAILLICIGLMGCMPTFQQLGYANEVDFKFAQTLSNATPQRICALKSYGISSEDDFAKLLTEIKAVNYSDNTNWDTIFNYLKDRKDAKAAGISIQELIKKRKIEFAKNYPYEAILNCQLYGESTDIINCFVGSNPTRLFLVNGGESKVYGYFDVSDAGKIMSDGMHIPLRKNFSLKAQNNSKYAALTLKVIDIATGKVLNNQVAPPGEFKFVSIGN